MDFYGFPSPDGQAGARNMVAIIPSTGCVNGWRSRLKKWWRAPRRFRITRAVCTPRR